jgi:hypothetical protein
MLLDRMPPRVASVAHVAFAEGGRRQLEEFPRKFAALADPAAGPELMFFPHQMQRPPKGHARLIGGLVHSQSSWASIPS